MVTRTPIIADYKDFSLSPDGLRANTPKEISPDTMVYGTSPSGERLSICNVGQALIHAISDDVAPDDPWLWEFSQDQFDNRIPEEPDYDSIERNRDDWRYAE
jgi:hypothetical protein